MQAIPLAILLTVPCWSQVALGTWKMNSARSEFIGDPRPTTLTVRFEPHAKGEVFTLDRVEANGQASTFSIILYLDGKSRDFQGSSCSGTQSSRRMNSQTVEIVLDCNGGQSTQFIRRLAQKPNELVLDITQRLSAGQTLKRRLILEKR